jgi:pimeloyl-ACP methyl ester carboxylesterase
VPGAVRSGAVLAFVVALLAAFPILRAAADGARVERVSCPFEVPEERVVECAFVTRPLGGGSRANLDVRLFTMIVRAKDPVKDAPLVYLDGGPGGMSFLTPDQVGAWWWLLETYPFLAERDLVVIAQRGSQPSEPGIDCPAFKAAVDALLPLPSSMRGSDADTRLQALQSCVDALRARGIALDAFTTPHRAADVPALLEALGYAAWHLWGVSYGTHLALSILRDHPRGIRSMILESVMTPAIVADLVPEDRSQFRRGLFAACAEDGACAERFPDPEGTFRRVARRLDAKPAVVALDRGAVLIDGAMLEALIEVTAYYTEFSRRIPAGLAAADEGIDWLLEDAASILAGYEREDGLASLALDTRWCAEAWPYLPKEAASVADIHELRHANVPDGETWCRAIGVGPLGPESLAAAASDVPVLMLTGTLDTVTPTAWAEEAARTLSRVTVIAFPGRAHAFAWGDGCAMAVAGAFLDEPASAADAPCLATLAPPRFDVWP